MRDVRGVGPRPLCSSSKRRTPSPTVVCRHSTLASNRSMSRRRVGSSSSLVGDRVTTRRSATACGPPSQSKYVPDAARPLCLLLVAPKTAQRITASEIACRNILASLSILHPDGSRLESCGTRERRRYEKHDAAFPKPPPHRLRHRHSRAFPAR